jgi:hypothetical protein
MQETMTSAEKAEIIAEQATPEWQAASNQARALLAKIAGKTMP